MLSFIKHTSCILNINGPSKKERFKKKERKHDFEQEKKVRFKKKRKETRFWLRKKERKQANDQGNK